MRNVLVKFVKDLSIILLNNCFLTFKKILGFVIYANLVLFVHKLLAKIIYFVVHAIHIHTFNVVELKVYKINQKCNI